MSATTKLGPPIGLLGGTFDPVHRGHIAVALDVAKQCGLDDLRLMPNPMPAYRQPRLLPDELRMQLLELAVAEHNQLTIERSEWLAYQSGEIDAAYTVDSLKRLRGMYPQRPLLFVLGDDAYAGIDSWKNYQQLPELCHLLVLSRPGYSTPVSGVAAKWLQQRKATAEKDLHNSPAGIVQRCEVSAVDIAATEIRAQLRAGVVPKAMLPAATVSLLESYLC